MEGSKGQKKGRGKKKGAPFSHPVHLKKKNHRQGEEGKDPKGERFGHGTSAGHTGLKDGGQGIPIGVGFQQGRGEVRPCRKKEREGKGGTCKVKGVTMKEKKERKKRK